MWVSGMWIFCECVALFVCVVCLCFGCEHIIVHYVVGAVVVCLVVILAVYVFSLESYVWVIDGLSAVVCLKVMFTVHHVHQFQF